MLKTHIEIILTCPLAPGQTVCCHPMQSCSFALREDPNCENFFFDLGLYSCLYRDVVVQWPILTAKCDRRLETQGEGNSFDLEYVLNPLRIRMRSSASSASV